MDLGRGHCGTPADSGRRWAIDGVHFAESCCIVALGIDIEGDKHPLASVEGSTENATLVTDLLVDLPERRLDVTRPMLVGFDGSEALRKAVIDVLDHRSSDAASCRRFET